MSSFFFYFIINENAVNDGKCVLLPCDIHACWTLCSMTWLLLCPHNIYICSYLIRWSLLFSLRLSDNRETIHTLTTQRKKKEIHVHHDRVINECSENATAICCHRISAAAVAASATSIYTTQYESPKFSTKPTKKPHKMKTIQSLIPSGLSNTRIVLSVQHETSSRHTQQSNSVSHTTAASRQPPAAAQWNSGGYGNTKSYNNKTEHTIQFLRCVYLQRLHNAHTHRSRQQLRRRRTHTHTQLQIKWNEFYIARGQMTNFQHDFVELEWKPEQPQKAMKTEQEILFHWLRPRSIVLSCIV